MTIDNKGVGPVELPASPAEQHGQPVGLGLTVDGHTLLSNNGEFALTVDRGTASHGNSRS